MKKMISLILSLSLLLSLFTPALATNDNSDSTGTLSNFTVLKTYPDGKFKDIPADAWYLESVKTSYGMGLFNGKTESTFDPTGNITIAQSIALAARLHSIYYTGKADFQQGSPWYQEYLDYAINNGIMTGDEFTNYYKTATRGEVAYLFAHAFPEEALVPINDVALSAIPDVNLDKNYSQEIYTLYRAGITAGFDSKGTFSPDSPIRRSHVAAMIVRMANAASRVGVSLPTAENLPDTYGKMEEKGIKTFRFLRTSLPVDFGLPRLTDAELDWLISMEDPKLAADAIATVADAVRYFHRAEFKGYHSNYETKDWFTQLCGEQVVARRGGNCGAMCNATAYLLRGDYEEIGFVLVTSHVMLYIKAGSTYYILNPSNYTTMENGMLYAEDYASGFGNFIWAADSLQDLADSFVGEGWSTHFHTYTAEHDMLPQTLNGNPTSSNKWFYPTGSEVFNWTPDSSTVNYKAVSASYGYDWRTDCWLSESVVTPNGGQKLYLPGDYPGRF